MSLGAKEVLIKSVPQAILTYVMAVFKLPTTLCEEMEQLIQYFLAGIGEGPEESSFGGMGKTVATKVSWWDRI
jgi:hypothetical protein